MKSWLSLLGSPVPGGRIGFLNDWSSWASAGVEGENGESRIRIELKRTLKGSISFSDAKALESPFHCQVHKTVYCSRCSQIGGEAQQRLPGLLQSDQVSSKLATLGVGRGDERFRQDIIAKNGQNWSQRTKVCQLGITIGRTGQTLRDSELTLVYQGWLLESTFKGNSLWGHEVTFLKMRWHEEKRNVPCRI